jgi:site-specific recombinase XerD
MTLHAESVWSGWKLTPKYDTAPGGSEARAHARLVEKRRRQLGVLKLLNKTHPQLIRGERNLDIPVEVVRGWVEMINSATDEPTYEIRDKINFLALGLERGRKILEWIVEPPAPLQIVRSTPASYTPDRFLALSEYRDWHYEVVKAMKADSFTRALNPSETTKNNQPDPELASWGTVLFFAINQGALADLRHIYALPLATPSLTIHENLAWLVLFNNVPEGFNTTAPATYRWFPGDVTLAVLLKHLSVHGHPEFSDYQQAKRFTDKAWKTFAKALSVPPLPLKQSTREANCAASFDIPQYLAKFLIGRHLSSSLPEERWQHLVTSTRMVRDDIEQNTFLPDISPTRKPQALSSKSSGTMSNSKKLLDDMSKTLYKQRDEKRHTFAELSRFLENGLERAINEAPIVESLFTWIKRLHQRDKLSQSTLYSYFNAVGKALFHELGMHPISHENIEALAQSYQSVIDQSVSPKRARFKAGVLRSFHRVQITDFGLPPADIEGATGNAVNIRYLADANLISEKEYEMIGTALKADDSQLGTLRYWIFVLGYRAGLRIGEALSIRMRDILLTRTFQSDAEFILLRRANRYVANKSHDSQRQLPLHLLLAQEERIAFEEFVRFRREVTSSVSVMLFSERNDAAAPLTDEIITKRIRQLMYHFTGDSSLRFHHLRHSLANNLLLAYHRITPPWESPGHLGKLFESINFPSMKGLFLVAQTLGHGSPGPTLKHYIHCHDFIIRHYLNAACLVSVDNADTFTAEKQFEPVLDFVGWKPATLRQWKKRYGPYPTKWLSRAFKGAPFQTLDSLEGQLYSAAQPENAAASRRAIHELSLHEIESIFAAARRMSPQEVEDIFAIHKGSYFALEKAHARILLISAHKGGSRFRHIRPQAYLRKDMVFKGHFHNQLISLPPPSSERERRVSARIYENILAQLGDSTSREGTRLQLRYFYKFHRASEGHVWLRNPEKGADFLEWACRLTRGLKVVLHAAPTLLSDLSVNEQKREWKKLVKEKRIQANIHFRPAGRKFRNRLGTANAVFNSDNVDSHNRGYTVRYTLLMACVAELAETVTKQK